MHFQSLILAGTMATGVFSSALPVPGPTADGLVPIATKKLASGSTAITYSSNGDVTRRSALVPIASKKLASGSTALTYGSNGDVTGRDLDKRIWPFDDPKTKYCHVDSDPKCDDDNGGPNETCGELVVELQGDRARVQPADAKQYCIKSATEKLCCVKWTKAVTGLTNGDLAGVVEKATTSCTLEGISAKYNSVNLKNTCLSVCINNGHGCKDESVFKSD